MIESCVVEIGAKMCDVLKGKNLKEALNCFCVQFRAWILESKLPFDVLAVGFFLISNLI